MKTQSKFVGSFILAALLSGALATPFVANGSESLRPMAGPESGPLLYTVSDSMGADRTSLAMQPSGVGIGETRGDWIGCLNVYDKACSTEIEGLSGKSILTPCVSEVDENCIVGMRIGTTSSDLVEAELIREAVGGISMPAVPEYNWIRGGNPSLWRTQLEHLGGSSDYAVVVSVGQYFTRSKNKFEVNFLQAYVVPYNELLSPDYEPYSIDLSLEPGSQIVNGRGGIDGCVWREVGRCGKPQDFAQGTVVELEMRLPREIGGWFQGRFKDPVMKIDDFSAKNVNLTVKAESIETPYFRAKRNTETLEPEEYLWYQNNGANNLGFGNETSMGPGDPRVFDYVEHFREELSDQIAGKKTIWMLSTTFFSNGTGCYSDSKIQGIVSTNAMGYDSNAPAYDSGFLNYRVTGLHFEEDGQTPTLGTYDLILDSEVARCMYGFNKAPISATVQVVGGASENIATTIVSEKDGWLKLAAYGFTFSEKEIQVKLTQPFNKTLTKFTGTTKALSSKQKAEVKATVTKAKGNPKFICTGVYVKASSKATALARARAACNYAKSLDKNHSYYAQAKQTTAKSYDAKVMLVSK